MAKLQLHFSHYSIMSFPLVGIQFQKLFLSSVVLIITFYTNEYKYIDVKHTFPDPSLDFNLPHIKQYDFIIAGAGPAGCVLANKLSRYFRVLLLEAGGKPVPQTRIPSYSISLQKIPPILHSWTSTEQSNVNLDNIGIVKEIQGKIFGGSSAINGMVYNRGNLKDYDNWAKITGDDSWTYANICKFFKRTENFYDVKNKNGELGVRGPLGISVKTVPALKKSYEAFLATGKELGYNTFENSNNPQKQGIGPTSTMTRYGKRISAYDAFIQTIQNRKNLHISMYSFVDRVDIDHNNRAVGVYYTKHGIKCYARAKFEVIVSAGALNSPTILMRSGIGPAKDLKALGIPVKADLPVGKHLQDHPAIWNAMCAKLDNSSNLVSYFERFSQKDVDTYLKSGKGLISLPDGNKGLGFLVSSIAKAEGTPDWPDIQLGFVLNTPMFSQELSSYKLCFLLYVGRPISQGSISLDPKTKRAVYNPEWLKEDRDVQVMIEGLNAIRRFSEARTFKSAGINFPQNLHPKCNSFTFGSDNYWKCFIRQTAVTGHHPVGTCRMGSKSGMSVVDSEFRVWGITGLRVIDNSIQPVIVNTNTNAAAYMIGQKGAGLLLAKYSKRRSKDKKSGSGIKSK